MDDLIIDLDNDKKQPNIYITPIREQPPLESPSQEKKRIENQHLKDEWRGCCSKHDKHFIKYMAQILMGSSVMIFAMAHIAVGAKNQEIYFSLLSGTLGIFLPHPQIKVN
jgi:hypothetical protein